MGFRSPSLTFFTRSKKQNGSDFSVKKGKDIKIRFVNQRRVTSDLIVDKKKTLSRVAGEPPLVSGLISGALSF